MRELRARKAGLVDEPVTCREGAGRVEQLAPVPDREGDSASSSPAARGDATERADQAMVWRPVWVAVIAAHSEAGASTVALAIADAAAAALRRVHVVEVTPASAAELLGSDPTRPGGAACGVWSRSTDGPENPPERVAYGLDDDAPHLTPTPGEFPEPGGSGRAVQERPDTATTLESTTSRWTPS